VLICLPCLCSVSYAVFGATPNTALSLKGKTAPEPNLTDFVYNKQALIALGKALFWDMQVGSDGVQACASCHFNAGADSRSKNQISPGLLRALADTNLNPDNTFKNGKGPNYQLKATDFPFHKLKDPLNRNSTVSSDTNDVESSQGVFLKEFVRKSLGCDEVTGYLKDDVFQVGGVNTRRVEPRHTPTVINAVFNLRNFWDGRAQHIFNGVNNKGDFDPNAHLYKSPADLTSPPLVAKVRLDKSSLASQATAPPVNDKEMSAQGRTFRKIGKRLVNCRPLAKQLVHLQDSVLGTMSASPSPGLTKTTYFQMIREAFLPQWWFSNYLIQVNADGTESVVSPPAPGADTYTLMEYNFSLFFGLAVQAYEATLVSDDTPFDRYNCTDPNNPVCGVNALNSDQTKGMDLFFSDRSRCANCHGGAELTDAGVFQIADRGRIRRRSFEVYTKDRTGKLVLKRKESHLIDTGFNNIGVRPTLDDLGVGSKFTPGGNLGTPLGYSFDLSFARRALLGICVEAADCVVPVKGPCDKSLDPPNEVLDVDGAVKIPGLRNVALTAPYFRNGGNLGLIEVLDFYFRGGDFQPITGWDPNRIFTHNISPLVTLAGPNFEITLTKTKDANCNDVVTATNDTPLTTTEKGQLLSFLLALTDERVRNRQAPFDHPQLFVPNGHPGSTTSVTNDGTGYATDSLLEIPATGRNGGTPLKAFLN
jgi:cytochrome c peroxidase